MQITQQLTLLFISVLMVIHCDAHDKQYTIMLDPAGDARHTGRIIGDSFERATMFQIAKLLQQRLESAAYRVLITRGPGEIIYPLQSANFANRLSIDLYCSLHGYHDPHEKHTIALYLLSYADPFKPTLPDIALIPCTKAHWQSSEITKNYAEQIHAFLQSQYAHQFQLPAVAAIPFVPLLAIQAPAIGIELNIAAPDTIEVFIEPLAQSIMHVVHS